LGWISGKRGEEFRKQRGIIQEIEGNNSGNTGGIIQETEGNNSGNRGEEFRKQKERIRKVKFCVAIPKSRYTNKQVSYMIGMADTNVLTN